MCLLVFSEIATHQNDKLLHLDLRLINFIQFKDICEVKKAGTLPEKYCFRFSVILLKAIGQQFLEIRII